jgi:hypothetical protein
MRRILAGLLWLALLLGGGFITLYGIVLTARFGGYGWETTMFGFTVDPAVPGILITLVGVLAVIGAWLLDQRWSQKRKLNDPR